MADKILPRNLEENVLDFGARVAKALGLEEVEIRPCAEGFAIVMDRELTLDEFVLLSNSGINYRLVIEFE